MSAAGNRAPAGRREVLGWCLYDFANSAFTTVVVTFVYSTYFTRAMAEDQIAGTALWTRGATVSALFIAALSPFMGALADRGGYRKTFLGVTTAISVLGCLGLYWLAPGPGQAARALACFVVANVAFELAGVFYNAFLPEIAPPGRVGRISGYGWALGYVGGLLALVLVLVALVQPEVPWFGFSKEDGQHVRAANLVVAAWFALFSIPTFLWLRGVPAAGPPAPEGLVRATLGQLRTTFVEMRRYREVLKLLLARLVYNDGLITIFVMGGIYAQGTFGFETQEVIVFGIVLNITAGLGAFAMGFLDDRLGGRDTILISIAGLIAATILAVLARDKLWFWVAGIVVGVFAGPNQASSRSLLARFVPPDKENEFFGFFAFSGKATSFAGPLLFGILTTTFASQRAGVAVLLGFFVLGGLLLLAVNEAEGKRVAAGA